MILPYVSLKIQRNAKGFAPKVQTEEYPAFEGNSLLVGINLGVNP
jgi:hypothetical protein